MLYILWTLIITHHLRLKIHYFFWYTSILVANKVFEYRQLMRLTVSHNFFLIYTFFSHPSRNAAVRHWQFIAIHNDILSRLPYSYACFYIWLGIGRMAYSVRRLAYPNLVIVHVGFDPNWGQCYLLHEFSYYGCM